MLPRPSFRLLLLAAFVLVALLLGGLALRGQLALEELLDRGRREAAQTQTLTGHAERLAEQALAMERSARQYLVLGDGSLLQRYRGQADDAEVHLRALAGEGPARDAVMSWRMQHDKVRRLLDQGPDPALDPSVVQSFREISASQSRLTEHVRQLSAARNTALQAEIDATRLALGRQWAGAGVLVLVLALALAFALARPLARVESAIVALGENRLDDRIEIPGPSDVRQIGRRLDWLRLRLAGQDADKARFLRHVSHELKTPLAALREGVALLQDGVAGPLSTDQREVARILADNSVALQRRIEDLLSFNATAFAAQRLVRRPVAMASLLNELVQAQQLQWRTRGLLVEVVGDELVADVDAALLRSALENLLTNAIRYSPGPGRGARIRLELAREGDGLTITVSDEGPGVADHERDRIFEPFYRGAVQAEQDDGAVPGTGIGLSIVVEAVAAHGGTVELLPKGPLSGASFRIHLPHALAD